MGLAGSRSSRRGFRHQLRCEIAASAGAIVDHHRLAKALGKFLSEQPRHGVVAAAGREADDHADGFGRVGGGGFGGYNVEREQRQRKTITICFY